MEAVPEVADHIIEIARMLEHAIHPRYVMLLGTLSYTMTKARSFALVLPLTQAFCRGGAAQ